MKQGTFTAVLEKEGEAFVALCPELDVASQGETVEKALGNLREAVELFLECASPEEVVMQQQVGSTTITVPIPMHREIRIGTLQSIIRQSGLPRSEFER
jgi:predicted RNase H-like HicB family nuclease